MNSSDKLKILITCYTFPPSNRIGGKRWYNLGKKLAEQHEVHILTFTEGVKKEQFESVTYIKPSYPNFLNKSPRNRVERLKYSYHFRKQRFLTKGSHMDKGERHIGDLQKSISKLQNKFTFDLIITTGAPFSLLYAVSSLKTKQTFKQTLFFSDLRDPWTWGEHKGMTLIDQKRRDVERSREAATMKNSHCILLPNKHMQAYVNKNYPDTITSVVPHGFELNLLHDIKSKGPKNLKKGELKLIYGGSWYPDIDDVFIKTLNILSKSSQPVSYKVYTNQDSKVKKLAEKSQLSTCQVSGYIDEESLFNEIYNSDFYFVLFPDQYKDKVSAKFFEIFFLGTPIVYIGNAGEVSDYLTKYGLGIHVLPTELDQLASKLATSKLLNPDSKLTIENYSFKNISNQLLSDYQKLKLSSNK